MSSWPEDRLPMDPAESCSDTGTPWHRHSTQAELYMEDAGDSFPRGQAGAADAQLTAQHKCQQSGQSQACCFPQNQTILCARRYYWPRVHRGDQLQSFATLAHHRELAGNCSNARRTQERSHSLSRCCWSEDNRCHRQGSTLPHIQRIIITREGASLEKNIHGLCGSVHLHGSNSGSRTQCNPPRRRLWCDHVDTKTHYVEPTAVSCRRRLASRKYRPK